MGKFKDLTGQKFGRLTALYRLHNVTSKRKRTYWLCICDCGNLTEVETGNLRSSNTNSCGCYNKQRAKESNQKHGKCKTRLYNIYNNMKQRCTNKNNERYKDYGGRGIVVCNEWLDSFQTFHDWAMENGYKEGLTLDRVNNNKDYSPDNCHWADIKAKNRNKRSNRNITINGETHCLKEWCEILGLKIGTVKKRIYCYHWNIYKALEVK